MPKAKRAAQNDGNTKPRRKSARLSEKHKEPDFDAALLPPHHLYTTRGSLPLLGDVIDFSHKYRRVYECTQPEAKGAHHLRHHHARTLSAKAQLEAAMQAVHRAVEEYEGSIEDAYSLALDNIRNKQKKDSRWYRQQNLLSFAEDDLEFLFQDYQVKDAADFSAYLIDIVGTSIDRPGYPLADLIEGFRLLKRYLRSSSDPSAEYQLFQLLITVVARHPALIDEVPKTLWSPHWMPETDTDRSKYWGAAAARRELFNAYRKRRCNKGLTSRYNEEECYHSKYIDLLQGLQERAHKEVRRAVLLAVGDKFSIELVDIIHGYTLRAEELPATPEIHKEHVDRNKDSSFLDLYFNVEPEPELLEEYKCSSMKCHR